MLGEGRRSLGTACHMSRLARRQTTVANYTPHDVMLARPEPFFGLGLFQAAVLVGAALPKAMNERTIKLVKS